MLKYLEFIKAVLSLSVSFKIWQVGKIKNLALLYQALKPHLSVLKADDKALKARAITECIALASAYRSKNKAEFENLLDELDEISHTKKDELYSILKNFL